jgi:hypothetical protein
MTTIYIGDFLDLFDAFAAIRNTPARYPAELLENRRAEYVEQVHELTANDLANLDYGTFDLGTRAVISGGEILELGPQEATETDIPF